jgi:hypothetical protein
MDPDISRKFYGIMASNGYIALVVDGTSLKDRFGRTENVLDYPQALINVSAS